MSVDENEIYLSADLIGRWKLEYHALLRQRLEIATQIDHLHKKDSELYQAIENLRNKLSAAIPFSPQLSEWLEEQGFSWLSSTPSLTDAILKTLDVIPPENHMKRSQIMQQVPRFGYPLYKLQENQSYLYIAIKRLKERKLIEEPKHDQLKITPEGRSECQSSRKHSSPSDA